MAARQRLQVVLEARRASQRCWRCTLDLPRYHSTSSAIRQDSLRSTDTVSYGQVLQREIEKTLEAFFANTLEAAPRTLHKSESGTIYTERPFSGGVEDGGQMAVVSGSESQSTAIAQQSRQQIIPSDQPVTQRTSLQTPFSLGEADQKLIIRELDVDRPGSSSRLLVKDDQGHGVDAGTISPAIPKTYGKKGEFTLVPPNINGNSTIDEHGSRPVKENPQNSECQPDIRGSEELMAEKSGAHVKLSEEPFIRKYIGNGALNIPKIPEPFIRKYMFGNGALNIPNIPETDKILKLIRKLQHDLARTKELGCPTDANEVPLDGQREDEASYDALASLLDFYRDLHPPKTPAASERFEKSVSSARFSPENSLLRRAAVTMSGGHALDRQSLDSSKRLYSTSTIPNRHNATATSQTVRADMKMDPTITKESPDEPVKWKSTGVREYLRSWQEQNETAIVDTSGRPSLGPLSETQNLFTQSGEDDSLTTIAMDDEVDDEFEIDLTSDEPSQDIFTRAVFLRRGDLVELTAASGPILAIFVRNVSDQSQFYTIRGEWINRRSVGARWGVSQFMDPDDLNDILPYLPAEEVVQEKMDRLQPIDAHAPRDAGAKVIKQLSLFNQTTDAVFRKYAARLSRLYEIIAPSEPLADRINMSLKDIAIKVLEIEDPSALTSPMMWAVHKAVTQCQNIKWDELSSRQNPTFGIFPKHSLKQISQVREWVREYQESMVQETATAPLSTIDSTSIKTRRSRNPIATFVEKAKVAIQQSRQARSLSNTGFVGSSSTSVDIGNNDDLPYKEICMQEFNDNDKAILHYLNAWTTSSHLNPKTNLASLGPMILRAIGMYEDFELNKLRGYSLLQELGVITPWENRTVHQILNLNLPGHDSGFGVASRLSSDADREAKEFEPKDSMNGLRKDWGEMPVFCIDNAETQERDDGVSMELIDEEPSVCWLHIHVANPSAFITPDSAIARFAASLSQTVYFPEKKYTMLAPRLTKDHFSLASNRPCLTFSAKVSVDGDVLEKRITPGFVRNVHYLTAQMVARGLGLTRTDDESKTINVLTVGGRMPTLPTDYSDQTAEALIDPGHMKILQKMLELSESTFHKRALAGARDNSRTVFAQSRAITIPKVYLGQTTIKPFRIENKTVRQFEGDPIIALQRSEGDYSPVFNMINNLMVLGGNVAASWCSDRNIPIPYRGILRNPEPATPPEVFQRQVLDPQIAKYGHPRLVDLIRHMRLIGQAHASDQSIEHLSLGLPAYCKATSPLRRHVDLLAHWQIEAAIRHEAAVGASLIGSADDSYLPFSRAQVEEYAGGVIYREQRIALAQTMSIRHWICQAIFRAFYFKEAILPETFEVTTTFGKQRRGWFPGILKSWNVNVQMKDVPAVARDGGWKTGDVWEAKLLEVDTYFRTLEMEPIRLIERAKEMG